MQLDLRYGTDALIEGQGFHFDQVTVTDVDVQTADAQSDVCVPQCAVDADCDDTLFCNGVETCLAGVCLAGTPPCEDGVGCTADTCDEGLDTCSNVADDALCDNGLFCDGAETCDPVLDCQAGTVVDCDDGVGCTADACNEGTLMCDNIADDALCDNGLFCDGVDTCDPVLDCQSTGDPCVAPLYCDDNADQCVGPLEAGSLPVGAAPVTVHLTRAFGSPVVVTTARYENNTTPIVTRVSNVTPTSFDVRLQNPSNGPVATENVSYLVVDEGSWTMDGFQVEAQTYNSSRTDHAPDSWVADLQSYLGSYTNPVVVGQVMTENDPLWSTFWARSNVRTNPPSSSVLRAGKMVCQDPVDTRADETVGFVVFEAGHGTLGGVEIEARLGADTVRGVDDAPPYNYTFNAPFASAPSVAVMSIMGMDGDDGAWPQGFGATWASTTDLFLSLDEDQLVDAERVHGTEQVAYVAIEGPVVFPPPTTPTTCTMDAECDDGLYCNGTETCNAGSCQAGVPIVCDDGVACTDDSCSEETDSCVSLPINALCDNGVFCDGAETCDPVMGCQAGSDPCSPLSCDEVNDACVGSLESGSASVDGTPLTIGLTNSYISPVVVVSAQYDNNTIPIVPRVSNVTATSFDVRLQNPSSGLVVSDNISYLVVEEGSWSIDGVTVEAQTYTSTVTDHAASFVGESQSIASTFTNPVVLGQVMTENDADWSSFWAHGNPRDVPPTPSQVWTGKMVGEDTDTTRAAETVGFIIFEAGHGTIGGVEYHAELGPETVRGVDDAPPYFYFFNPGFASTPTVALMSMAGMDHTNGAWPQAYGPVAASTSNLFLSVDEDQIADAERVHGTENVAYLVFADPVVFPPPPPLVECLGDPLSGDGDGDGVCSDVDCDDADPNAAFYDSCGVCGGDNSSCGGAEFPPDAATMGLWHLNDDGSDASGAANHLTVDASRTSWVPGRFGSAIEMGANPVGTPLGGGCPGGAATASGGGASYPGSGDWTLEAWIKVPDFDTRYVVLSHSAPDAEGRALYQLAIEPGGVLSLTITDAMNRTESVSALFSSVAGDWIYVAATYREGRGLELYENFVLIGYRTTLLVPDTQTGYDLYVGGTFCDISTGLQVDEIRLSHYARYRGCLGNDPVCGVFADGFESGDTSVWSN